MTVTHPPSAPLILLVDDFDDARELYAEYLTFKGCRVTCAVDGQEALAAARAERPDVILLDLRMPHMTGTEVMKILRADPTFAGVPIVALTAHALDNERAAAIRAGFDTVIAKPCLPDELHRAVVALLARWQPRLIPGGDHPNQS